ncbi:MAG TPA: hypothetical protein VER11_08730 [Polyangiaceae bacterium]|nr:hypothetical protein [Polyangiaceae bacterium]
MNRIKGISAIWALPLLAGCSMDVGAGESADEPADTVSQAIFQAGCGTLPADKVIDASTNPRWLHNGASLEKPGCIGSRLLNVDNYQEGSDVRVTGATVAWGDAEPTTQAECERTWLGTMVYRKSGSSYVKVKENEARGVWVPPDNFPCPAGEICLESGNRCILPAVTYVSSVSDGQSYRFVGSARRLATPNGPADGSYFLRNVEFSARVTPLPPR